MYNYVVKRYLVPVSIFFLVMAVFVAAITVSSFNKMSGTEDESGPRDQRDEESVSLANPASVYCEGNGGVLEIVTLKDGGQIGMCVFEDYSCEEWAFMNGECEIKEDSDKIKSALLAKGLNLNNMEIKIQKHFGQYIEAAVVPVSTLGGGGYVFAVKTDGTVEVLADGNGAIMCESFSKHPEFPSYLVPYCIDSNSMRVER